MIRYTSTFVLNCDQCQKEYTKSVTLGDAVIAPAGIPDDWLQLTPPGETTFHEFCSVDCFTKYMAEVGTSHGT